MTAVRIGVKFCGNCNPHYDMPGLVIALAARAEGLTFVCADEGNYDVLFILNSCGLACATRPPFEGRVVAVTSESVDNWPVTEEELPTAVLVALLAAAWSV
ncbi:MAG: hypothetical protein ACRDBM_12460 [Sporomusa sp.]